MRTLSIQVDSNGREWEFSPQLDYSIEVLLCEHTQAHTICYFIAVRTRCTVELKKERVSFGSFQCK